MDSYKAFIRENIKLIDDWYYISMHDGRLRMIYKPNSEIWVSYRDFFKYGGSWVNMPVVRVGADFDALKLAVTAHA